MNSDHWLTWSYRTIGATVPETARWKRELFKSYAEWALTAHSKVVGYRGPGTSLAVVVLCSEGAIREVFADPALDARRVNSLSKLTNLREHGAFLLRVQLTIGHPQKVHSSIQNMCSACRSDRLVGRSALEAATRVRLKLCDALRL